MVSEHVTTQNSDSLDLLLTGNHLMHSFFPPIDGSHQLRDPSHPWHFVYNSGLNYTYGPCDKISIEFIPQKVFFLVNDTFFPQMGEFQLESPHDFSIPCSTILLDFVCVPGDDKIGGGSISLKIKQLKKLWVTPRNLGVKVLTPRTPFNEHGMFSACSQVL